MSKFRNVFFLAALIISSVVLYSFIVNAATDKGTEPKPQINFIENSWTEALKQAAAQHKYIFVDAYASWCGPCKMLRVTTFKDAKAAEFFNKNFVNVSIDMEKGQGPALSNQWNIQAYPTLIICNSSGKAIYGTVGYIGAKDLVKFGQQGLTK